MTDVIQTLSRYLKFEQTGRIQAKNKTGREDHNRSITARSVLGEVYFKIFTL